MVLISMEKLVNPKVCLVERLPVNPIVLLLKLPGAIFVVMEFVIVGPAKPKQIVQRIVLHQACNKIRMRMVCQMTGKCFILAI
jgi:hypothetical protein